jgi:hypothetical protein
MANQDRPFGEAVDEGQGVDSLPEGQLSKAVGRVQAEIRGLAMVEGERGTVADEAPAREPGLPGPQLFGFMNIPCTKTIILDFRFLAMEGLLVRSERLWTI